MITRNRIQLVLLIHTLVWFAGQPGSAQQQNSTTRQPPSKGPERWEKSIREFEKQDQKKIPVKKSLLFLGSSSIRMWDLEKWFPNLPCLNRGFGGSEIADSIHFFDRLVVPYQPKAIVFYAGDNDIANGKTAEVVFRDFKVFANKVKKKSPDSRIIFVAIKPSIARWKLIEEIRKANQLIKSYAETEDAIVFADIEQPMLDTDGQIRRDLFLKDGLHLNEKGYQVWFDVIGPLVKD